MTERFETGAPEALWYEAIQLRYRQAIVRLIREMMGAKFGDAAAQKFRESFGVAWAEMERKAKSLRDTGEIATPLADFFDILGVQDFYQLFEGSFGDLLPSQAALPEASEIRRAVLHDLRDVAAARHLSAHAVDAGMSRHDIVRSLAAAVRVLQRCGLPEAARVEEIYAQITGTEPERPVRAAAMENRLPARDVVAMDFVGRKRELDELFRWIDDPKLPKWVLEGEGGAGKTAIAYEFASRACSYGPAELEVALWVSAKRRRFSEGEVVEAEPDFWDLESCLDALLRQYFQTPTAAMSLDEKKHLLLEHLAELPALVVADDVDSLEGLQQQAIDFLAYEVPRTKSRLLMTSRTQLMAAGGITTKIHGLVGVEANAFIDSRILLFELDRNAFGPARRNRIQAVTKGSPLFMQDLMWLCRRSGVDEAIGRWERDGGEASRDYALKREFEQLPRQAQEVLLAASLFAGPVSAVEIRRITGFGEKEIDDAIRALQSSYLLPTPKLIETIDRFELNPNVRLVVRRALGTSEAFRRIERGALAVQGTLVSSAAEDREVRFFVHEALSLVDAGKFSEAEETLQAGLKRFENSPQLLGRLGWLYKNWPQRPRLADAREAFRRAGDLGARESLMYWNWMDLEQKEREWAEACRIAELARTACPAVVEFVQFEGFLRMRFGQDLRARFDQIAAKSEFEKASRLYWDALKRKSSDDVAQRALRGIVRCSVEVDAPQQAKNAVREWVARFGKDSPGVVELEQIVARRWPQ